MSVAQDKVRSEVLQYTKAVTHACVAVDQEHVNISTVEVFGEVDVTDGGG